MDQEQKNIWMYISENHLGFEVSYLASSYFSISILRVASMAESFIIMVTTQGSIEMLIIKLRISTMMTPFKIIKINMRIHLKSQT